jgi:hypothetical protein
MALLTGQSDKPKEEDGGTNSYAERSPPLYHRPGNGPQGMRITF